ncbi:hypothetical protein J6590_008516 [Homalodisca vitripennis]|nr:hypothetical protein J6590_008516 [Homalodisca vitripennis]
MTGACAKCWLPEEPVFTGCGVNTTVHHTPAPCPPPRSPINSHHLTSLQTHFSSRPFVEFQLRALPSPDTQLLVDISQINTIVPAMLNNAADSGVCSTTTAKHTRGNTEASPVREIVSATTE